MNKTKNVTRKFAIVLSALMLVMCISTTMPTKVFAATTDSAVTTTELSEEAVTRGAGGYEERTYSAPSVNQTFQLVPSSYDSRAKLTVELKRIDSGITSVWVEVVSNTTGLGIWSGFINQESDYKAERWFNMISNETYTVRTNVTGSGYVTVAASLWS